MTKPNLTPIFSEEIRKDAATMLDQHNVLPQFKEMTVEARQEYCENDRLPYDICLMNITGDLNHSTIIRSAHLMGCDNVYIIGRNRIDRRGLVGMEFYTKIHFLGGLENLDIDDTIFTNLLSTNPNYMPIFVETGGMMLGQFEWNTALYNSETGCPYRPLLILGNEGRGIPENILNLRSTLVRSMTVAIPMRGVGRSLNVSSAASIVMWDLIDNMEW